LAFDTAGKLWVADSYNSTIRKITPDGAVSTVAGKTGDYGRTDGPAADARFSFPQGIAVDSTGNVFVAETFYPAIRKVTPDGVVSTFAGDMFVPGGYDDGVGRAASFTQPWGLAIDASDNLYVSDSYGSIIRRITPSAEVTTYAGLRRDHGGI